MRRVLVLSHSYLQPAHRGKLRALAARGLEVTVAIPQRWREPWFGRPIDVAWERQGCLEVFPLPAGGMGQKGVLEKAKYARRALRALLRDRRPDLVQIEEEPTTHAARQVLAAARRLAIPVVLFTHQNVDPDLGWWARWKHRRMLRRLTGLVAASDLAGTLARLDAPNLPIAVIPQLGALAPHEPQHVPHEGLAIGFVGRLVHNKGIDNLLQALALADYRESNGLVLMEAMAHEVAVLGTDSGVIPELIGDAGVVVRAGDVPALAAGLEKLSDYPTPRAFAPTARTRALRA